MEPFAPSGPLPPAGRPVIIVWLFVGIVICLLGLTVYSSQLLSAGRALVGLETTWAKAQKNAVFHLTRYANYGTEDDLRSFDRAMGVIEAERSARHELRKPEPDYSVVRRGLVGVGVHPTEVDGLTTLYSRLHGFEPMDYVIAQWTRSDLLIDELRAAGAQLRSSSFPIEPERAAQSIRQINRINTSLAPLEDDLSQTLAEIQRTAQSLLTNGILVIAGVLLIAGITISRRFLIQNERLQQTLAESESQLRHLVETAPLPLLIVRAADQQFMYANERALEQFGLDFDSARQHSLGEFQVDPEIRAKFSESISRHGSVRDFEVPLKDLSGRQFWLLLSAQPMRYGGSVCLLVALANIDDRKRMQEDMRRKAMHDQLTGLPNRAMFMETLERAVHMSRRRSSRFSVLFVDLDRFKEVNDSMGHAGGDTLLRAVAERLGTAVRHSDLVARLGGDEFVILVEQQGGPEEVMVVAQKVLSMLERPVTIDWREATVSGSIGISTFPDDGTDVETLVKNADAAMYKAKERGRNNFQFYSAELNRLSTRRVEQERRVRLALERDEFFLEYQPEVDFATGRVTAVEALLRSRDPVNGVVMPLDFLPIAEETGTVTAIGIWVLDRALADLKGWQEGGLELMLAVNLSPRQLQQHDLPEEVSRLLAAHGIAPECLRLEITEPTLMLESEAAHRAILAMKALGVEMAIDNFGTGYSSLGLMRGLPIQVVKIDRSLVSSCVTKRECGAIVQAAVAMSTVLGIRVVAAGVETEEQRRAMKAYGCDAIQGYLVARPMPASGVAAITSAVAEQTFFA
ncbi:MAG: putative bifunctional diguanylate cyclase/phosphodiesterase [Usitatibacter sp.]